MEASSTEDSQPAVILLSSGARFLLGDLMNDDGTGFGTLDGGSVTLVGQALGATLDAERRGRMFYVTAGNLTLINVKLVNGFVQECGHSTPYDLMTSPICKIK